MLGQEQGSAGAGDGSAAHDSLTSNSIVGARRSGVCQGAVTFLHISCHGVAQHVWRGHSCPRTL